MRDPGAPSPADLPELSGRLEVLGALGRGGFAVVHRVLDRDLGRECALKVLHHGPGEALARFAREGAVAARLDHPGIVRVHAAGTFRGRPCLVYALVEGARPLDEAARGLPLRRRVELVRDAARAVGHAHACGVVHRDLKPENLLVDAAGAVRVADFGVAAAEGLARLTVTGTLVGTPTYMAPEQLGGHAGTSPAVDVWALGVVLHEVLTGERLFQAESYVELYARVSEGRVPPPRERAPEVTPAVAAVCLRALRLDPAARPADGEALARALDAALAAGDARPARRRAAALAAFAGCGAVAVLAAARAAPPASATPAPPAAPAPPGPGPTAGAPTAPPDDAPDPLATLEDPAAHAAGVRAAAAWLADHPAHPAAARVKAALAAARGEAPLLDLALPPHPEIHRSVQFLDARRLLTWGPEGLLRVLDPLRGVEALAVPLWVRALAAGPDGLAVVAPDGALTWRAAVDGPPRLALRCPGAVRRLALAPRRGLLAIAVDGRVVVFALSAGVGVEIERLDPGWDATVDVAFSPGEDLLAAGGRAGASGGFRMLELIRTWRVDGWAPLASPMTVASTVNAVAFSPDGATLAAGTSNGRLFLLDPRGGREPRPLVDPGLPPPVDMSQPTAHTRSIRGLAYAPDGRLHSLAGDAERGELAAWDPAAGRLLRPKVASARPLASLAVDPTGRLLAAGTLDGRVLVLLAR